MTFTDYLPPKTWAFLVKTAQENKLSIKEVQRIFLNKVATDLGFRCDHERIGYSKSDKKPFCKDCWTRLRTERREPYRIGTKLIKEDIQYVEKKTFLDEFYKEAEREREDNMTKQKQKKETVT